MTSPNLHRRGRPYQRARAAMFAMYGDTCHLCGHRGARTADHLVPLAIDPHQPLTPFGMRPAHGTRNPCPQCGLLCNQRRGAKAAVPFDGRSALRTSRDWSAGRQAEEGAPEPAPAAESRPRRVPPVIVSGGDRPVGGGAAGGLKTSRRW